MGKFNDVGEFMTGSLLYDSDLEMAGDFTANPKRPEGESFQFTYISNSEFNAIYKQVKRERKRKREAEKWEKFVQKQQAKEKKGCLQKGGEGKDASTITNDASPSHSEPTLYNEPQILQAVSTIFNESRMEQTSLQCDSNIKEIFTAEVDPELKNSSQNIIQLVHVSSGTYEDHVSEDFKELNKVGGKYTVGKVERFQAKIITTLKVIEDVLSKYPYENISKSGIDVKRNQKRNVAFSKRFKSNYHYRLVCQIKEIEKLLRNKAMQKMKPNIKVIEKLLSSHQVIIQALQVVEKHLIGTYPINETFGWLRDFIELIYKLCTLPLYQEKVLDNYNEMKTTCEELINIIDDFNDRMAEMEMYEKFNKPLKRSSLNHTKWMYKRQLR